MWSVLTTEPDDPRYIIGPPRVYRHKMIGNAGEGGVRGYVTCYDADSGKKLWRFYTVPGNPADGFEDDVQKMAANTWSGNWWQFGGGGYVWNAITYDAELNRFYFGTADGTPFNRAIRSRSQSDNLFIASIVALDAETGEYVWHYQTNPGDDWDFDATLDLEIASLVIGGTPRKVLMQGSKNGFFYVLDRLNGKLISAEPYAKVTQSFELHRGRRFRPRSAWCEHQFLSGMGPSVTKRAMAS